MATTCPHCGAPIRQFQRECEYCGNEIESRENPLEQEKYHSIVPYGGKISAEFSLPMEIVFAFDDRGRERYCKERILAEMAEELLEHIEIQTFCKPTMDFREGPYRVRGTLVLGAIPGSKVHPYSNTRTIY